MATDPKLGFLPDVLELTLSQLKPERPVDDKMRRNKKYRQIAASVKHVGVIEPLIVYREGRGKYRVVDGNKRLDILSEQGATSVRCLLTTDDEAYTYNKRVNYLSPIGEHFMILRALSHVSESRIAAAADVDVATIRTKRSLIEGVCPEAVDALKDKRVTAAAFRLLRRMKALRQVDVARLMIAANNYSQRFVEALLVGTPEDLLIEPRRERGSARPDMLRMRAALERETETLLRDYKTVEASYGKDVLTLSVSIAYVKRLLANARILRYLEKRHPDFLDQLQKVIAEMSTEGKIDGMIPAPAQNDEST
jgi:RepB plasmid partitioning protein/ParB-like nuclease domain